jgi:hypothetical protein
MRQLLTQRWEQWELTLMQEQFVENQSPTPDARNEYAKKLTNIRMKRLGLSWTEDVKSQCTQR